MLEGIKTRTLQLQVLLSFLPLPVIFLGLGFFDLLMSFLPDLEHPEANQISTGERFS